jgi:hypothetical protein
MFRAVCKTVTEASASETLYGLFPRAACSW